MFFARHSATREFLLRQALFLLPLVLLLLCLQIVAGGAGMEALFAPLRKSHELTTRCIRLLTRYGAWCFYVLYAVMLWLAWRRKNRTLMRVAIGYALAQVLVSVLCVQLLKWGLGRPRPYIGGTEWHFFSASNDYHSMPSGHTTDAATSAGPLAQMASSRFGSLIWGLYPAAIAFTRIYLANHHPGDVLAGALLGSAATWLIWRFAGMDRNSP